MNVVVSRSPLRLLTYVLLAVPAILLAVDMTVSHRWIRSPETTDVVVGQTADESGDQVDVVEAVLTDAGRAERRRDVLFGGVLFIGGMAITAWALRELTRPSRFLIADEEGLLLRVDGLRRPPRRFGWSDIEEIRSGVIEDDGVEIPVLSIRLFDPFQVPAHPAGGVAEPPWLHLYSDEWDMPAHQVAPLLDHRLLPTPLGDESAGEGAL